MSKDQNPYSGQARRIWFEGFGKAKRDDCDAIIAMHKALLSAKREITNTIRWYLQTIKESYSACED